MGLLVILSILLASYILYKRLFVKPPKTDGWNLPDIPVMPPLPPLPPPPIGHIPNKHQKICKINMCPIKSHTNVSFDKNLDPVVITDEIDRILRILGIKVDMLQKGLKLSGTTKTITFVFQLFLSDDDTHYIGVFRRIRSDSVRLFDYIDIFNQITDHLKKGCLKDDII